MHDNVNRFWKIRQTEMHKITVVINVVTELSHNFLVIQDVNYELCWKLLIHELSNEFQAQLKLT